MAKIYKGRDPYVPVSTGKAKTELDKRGVPKAFNSLGFRDKNYFYRVFDHIGRQLNDAN